MIGGAPIGWEIQRRLLAGSPRVYIQIIGSSGELYVDPMNLEEGQHEVVAERLREVLLEAAGRIPVGVGFKSLFQKSPLKNQAVHGATNYDINPPISRVIWP